MFWFAALLLLLPFIIEGMSYIAIRYQSNRLLARLLSSQLFNSDRYLILNFRRRDRL